MKPSLPSIIFLALLSACSTSNQDVIPTPNVPEVTTPVVTPSQDALSLMWFARDEAAKVLAARPASEEYLWDFAANWSASVDAGQFTPANLEWTIYELTDPANADGEAAIRRIQARYVAGDINVQTASAVARGVELAIGLDHEKERTEAK